MLNKQSGGKESQDSPPADALFNHFKALSTSVCDLAWNATGQPGL